VLLAVTSCGMVDRYWRFER